MALSWRRWVAAALLGAALIAVALLPPSPDYWESGFRFAQPSHSRLSELDALIRAEHGRLALERRMLDIRAQLRRTSPPRDGRPQLGFTGPIVAHLATTLRAGWDSALADLAPFTANVSALLILESVDSAVYTRRPVAYFLPEATGGQWCVAVAQLDRSQRLWGGTAPRSFVQRALGPCAYYAAFGAPGRGVRALLARAQMLPAYAPDWAGPARARSGAPTVDPDFLARNPDRLIQAIVARPFLESFAATACAAGQLEQCRPALESTEGFLPRSWREVRPPDDVMLLRGWLQPWWDREVAHFFADLIREQGRDAFQRFWSSPLPADSAFRDAFGVAIEPWTRQWLRRGRDLRYGPAIRGTSVTLSLLLTVALVGAAAAWTMRRQVS